MRTPSHPTLIKRLRHNRLKQMLKVKPFVSASLVETMICCGRPGCHCQKGDRHVGYYLTYKVKGKTKRVYVPVDMRDEVRQWIREHRRIRQLSQEISQLSLALVRTHVRARKRRRGR
jgi:hypothetical protein